MSVLLRSFIHRNVIFHKILRDHRCARPDLGADVLKPVLTLIIVRMMVDADDLISRNIDDVGIALLGIHQYHFVLIRQHFGQILHIQQFNVKNLTQTAGTVPVDLALIADARLDTLVASSRFRPYALAIASGSGKLCVCI